MTTPYQTVRDKSIERLQLRHNNDVIRARESSGVQPCGTWVVLLRSTKTCEIHSLAWRRKLKVSLQATFSNCYLKQKKDIKKRFELFQE